MKSFLLALRTSIAIAANFALAVFIRLLDIAGFIVLTGMVVSICMVLFYALKLFWQLNGQLMLRVLSGMHVFFIALEALLVAGFILGVLVGFSFLLNDTISASKRG